MIIAITGGTGFIGKNLVLRHLAQGDEVRVLSRRPQGKSGLPDAVQWHHGDLSAARELQAFVDGADILYHCAGEIRDEARMRQVHIEGTQHLIHAAAGKIKRWVQLSSVGAYGQRRAGVVTELSELKPCGVYETTKVESDRLIQTAAREGAFEYSILRPSIVYGAEMGNRSLFGMIAMIDRGLFFFIGKPGASANYIHVDNVVEALLLCGAKPDANGQVYNLSDHCTMEHFVAAIAAALGKPTPRLRVPEWPIRQAARLLGKLPRFPLTLARVDALTGRAIYSTDKIGRELGYRHIVSMEAGLTELTTARLQPAGAEDYA